MRSRLRDRLRDDADRIIALFQRNRPNATPSELYFTILAFPTKANLQVADAVHDRLVEASLALVPEVRARAMDEFARTITVISEALAKRTGRPADDLAVRVVAGAIVGVIMYITMPWEGWSSDQQIVDMFARIDQALALLEAGLPL